MTRTPREAAYETLLARYSRERQEARARFPDNDDAFLAADDAAWTRYVTVADDLMRCQPVRLPGDATGSP